MKVFMAFIVFLLVLGLYFLFASGIIAVFCWAFGITFLWKYTFGVWAALVLVSAFKK